MDNFPWRDLSLENKREDFQISQTPDHRRIAWVKVATGPFSQGRHTLSVRVQKSPMGFYQGAIDAIMLTNEGLVPSGGTKPQDLPGGGADEWFAVVVDSDDFSDHSVIDMSGLLHRPAGAMGFLQQDSKELHFENGDGPAKFWGTVGGCDPDASDVQMVRRARFLAKHGINMVRQHSVEGLLGHRTDPGYAKRLDAYDRWFAALKDQGIYVTWSVFYPHRIKASDGYDPALFAELPGGDLKSTSGMVNFVPALQDLEWQYVQALLDHVNPYTGLAYKDDPALAVVEVHNEDCIFFHAPLNSLTGDVKFPRHAALLRQMFRNWAQQQYGTDAALQKAWGTRDSFRDKEFRIYGAWEFKGDKADRRMGDFIRFLAETQRGYYERRLARLREAGYRGVTITTAWHAGGPAADPANTWCDSAMQMISRHNYFGGGAGGHDIALGKVNNGTHLDQAGSGILASGMYQVEDRAFCLTEWTVLPPNQHKLEIAPLFAFYGMGLQGWDASYHFANGRGQMGDGWPGLRSYVTETPHYIGQFPALAFAVYRGHIEEAPLAAARRLEVDDLFLGLDPLNQDFTGGGYDAKELQGSLATPREVLAIGRVTTSFDGGASEKVDWNQYWDRSANVVRSMTGQLTWDMNRRVVTLAGPKTAAVIGFAGGQRFELQGVTVEPTTEMLSLIFTPLDDQPLAESKHILITAMARDQQTGTRYNAGGTELLEIGRPPLLMEPVQARITFQGAAPAEVNVLDFHGVPTGKTVPVNGNAISIDGTYRTYYYEVKR